MAMSVMYKQAQEQVQASEQPSKKSVIELCGRWLLLARTVGLTLSILTFGLFVAGMPLRFHELVTLSMQTEYALPQLSPGWGRALLQSALSINFYPVFVLVIEVVLVLGFTLSALLVYWRKSDDWRSMLGSLGFIMYGIYVTGSLNALAKAYPSLQFPVNCLHALGIGLALIFFYILPDARFVPRWTRPLAVIWVTWTIAGLFFPATFFNFCNPFTLSFFSFLAFMIWWGTGLTAQYYRYRHLSNRRRQQQTRWVLLSLFAGIICYAAYYLPRVIFPALSQAGMPHLLYTALGEPLFLLSLLLIPLLVLFSILRYRLFGVDVIINRTLVYGTLTVVLALVYFSSVLLLQYLFHALSGQGSPLVIAGSTLVIALLFEPLRNRVQVVINRRFYRYRYDAAQTLAAFGNRLRTYDEVDLTTLANDVLEVVKETMQPAQVSIMLCEPATPPPGAINLAPTIKPGDPLVTYFLNAPGAVDIEKLHLPSPVLEELKASGVKLIVPMVNQGQVVGLLNLGSRMSEQDYSTDDRGLLNTLATQAAPAMRVAQLVREQHLLARQRERIEQEMRVARLIQQTLLPKDLPALPGWQLAAYYQPARAVGGDFYDFFSFEDGRLGIVIGDVTDKGVPAALLMATTRSILRSVAQTEVSPGKVLEQANNLLIPDIPPKLFVTCLYAILDTSTGRLRYANAGQDQPYQQHAAGASELWATGMPLGLMPDMHYEEKETILAQGESVLFYSDGLVEAHNPEYEMFGFPRLQALLAEHTDNVTIIDLLLNDLAAFTGPRWEQEDDVTLVTLQRSGG